MIERFYRLKCADCPTTAEYANKDEAKARGWAFTHGEKDCYCPACAFRHRHTGKGGAKPGQLPGQIAISEVKDSA